MMIPQVPHADLYGQAYYPGPYAQSYSYSSPGSIDPALMVGSPSTSRGIGGPLPYYYRPFQTVPFMPTSPFTTPSPAMMTPSPVSDSSPTHQVCYTDDFMNGTVYDWISCVSEWHQKPQSPWNYIFLQGPLNTVRKMCHSLSPFCIMWLTIKKGKFCSLRLWLWSHAFGSICKESDSWWLPIASW